MPVKSPVTASPFKNTRRHHRLLQLYYGLTDHRATLLSRIPAMLSLLYLLSPVDLIPDFIPLAGYVDDLVIVPLLLRWSFALLPKQVKEDALRRADRQSRKVKILTIVVVVLLLALLVLLVIWLKKRWTA